ncbi:hypothetical protein ASF89_08900 [Frigoribacterium sp. Leaf172]|nr:hypothetical protein ASF89_08900 [Frigoribacterium sp. Leaf172]
MNDARPMLDIRWTVPTGVAWAALVALLPFPARLGPAAVALGVVTLVSLAAAVVVARRREGTREARGATAAPGRLLATLVLVALGAGLAALLIAGAAVRHDTRYPPDLVALVGHTVELEGTISDRVTAASRVAALDARSVTSGDRAWHGRVSVLVLGPRTTDPVEAGQRVGLRATVLPVEPGGDTPFVVAARGALRPGEPASGLAGRAEAMRASFRDVTAGLSGDGAALLPGLAIGDTSAVPDDLTEAMRTSSLSHLTAVSGSNCAVLVALTMLVGGALGVPRVVRVAAASAVLLAFLVLVTPDASIVRATIMALVVLGHLAGSRPVSGLPVVAVAVTGMLLADPWISRSLGFALSVLATAGLVVLAAPLARLLSRIMPEPLALVLAVPIAAQLACGPVLLLLDPGLPLHGVAANVLAEPAAPVATVLGLIVCVLAGWAPGPAALVAQVAWAPASWVAAVARSVATWPAARIDWGQGVVAVGLLSVLTALVVVIVLARRSGPLRRAAATALVAVVVIAGGAVAGRVVGARSSVPGDWAVAQCDVGQGDAVLVRSAGRVALIDAGDDEEALTRCLGLFGVDRLDLLVLTHFDSDHVGAVAVVAERADVALVGPVGRRADEQVVESLRAAGVRVVDARAGTHGELGSLRWEVLWPSATGSSPAPGNGASLVTRFRPSDGCRAGCPDLVGLGDLGEVEQRRLRATGTLAGPIDVVKVAHHGSADQDAALYDALGAPVALIGVGADNTYGHPTAPLLEVLAETSAAVARSDLDGSAAVMVDDGGRRLWRERAPSSEASSTLVAASVPHPVAGGGPWPRERVPSRRRRPVSPSTRSGGTASGPPP